MRRLPVFLVLDLSESMIGDDHRRLQEGIKDLLSTLKTDPQALETVYLSVIGFAGQARTIVPLVELPSFFAPRLPVGSGTSLGRAMMHLMDEMDTQVRKTTPDQKGDWKPIVYLMTDGKPTDSIDAAVNRWNKGYASRAQLIAVGIGQYASSGALRRFTESVLNFVNGGEQDFKKFIRWISQSVSVQSRSVGMSDSSDTAPLATFDESFLKKVEQAASQIVQDEDFAIVRATCAKTKLPYLMKFERAPAQIRSQHIALEITPYSLIGVFPVEKDYAEWSDHNAIEGIISSDQLIGSPGCPHCGNPIGFAMCSCGSIMCISGPGPATCPACNREANFDFGEGPGFDVTRARG